MSKADAETTPSERAAIAAIFEQAQLSVSNHVKNHTALRKIHRQCAARVEILSLKKNIKKLDGEKEFRNTFQSMFIRILQMKKGVVFADNAIKFVAGYIEFINKGFDEDVETDQNDGDPASRFTTRFVQLLLEGFEAKDKVVRFRIVQSAAETASFLGTIDEDLFSELRGQLIKRLNDKEATIRVQAVSALAKLHVSEDRDDLNGEMSILEMLLDTLAHDPNPEIRRHTLVKIPVNHETINAILDRMTDEDLIVRKLVFANVLKKNWVDKDESGEATIGAAHPKALTISQRRRIVKIGLGDREHTVNSAAAALIDSWLELDEVKSEETDGSIAEAEKKKVLRMLELFDVAEERYAEKSSEKYAEHAVLSLFATRPALFNEIKFEGEYWDNLTLEKAFLARVFVQHCEERKDYDRLEDAMPVVTYISFRIETEYNNLVEDYTEMEREDISDDEYNRRDDNKLSKESILSELLKMAVHLDYADELGRRKFFRVIREMLRAGVLPEDLMTRCLEVLRELAGDERDLIRILVETIGELRENAYGEQEVVAQGPASVNDDEDTSFQEPDTPAARPRTREHMDPSQIAAVDQTDITCLALCIESLKLVNSSFQENSTLDAVTKELIFPSVRRPEPQFMERGLRALGLCCLIDPGLALKSMDFLKRTAAISQSSIKLVALQSLFDILMKHELHIRNNPAINVQTFTEFFVNETLNEQDPRIQAMLCLGVSKLILSGMIIENYALENLVKVYLSPLTSENLELRQCLSFFFPVYSYSSFDNQKTMCEIFITIFLDACEDRKQFKDSDDEALHYVSSTQLGEMFIDWTDPIRLKEAAERAGKKDEAPVDDTAHLAMAEKMVRVLFEKDLKVKIEKEDKKALCQMLNKLHIPDVVDDHRIRALKYLMDNLTRLRPLRDAVSRNAFTKFDNMISKKFEKQLEGFSEEEFRKLEELNDLFDFVDSMISLEEDEIPEAPILRRNPKRRSYSMASGTSESRANSPSLITGTSRSRAKRPRLSTTSNDDEATEEDPPSNPRPAPTRSLPKRQAAVKKPPQVIVISSDSEEETEIPPKPKKNPMTRYREFIKAEQDEAVLSIGPSSVGEVTFDSIMDSDPDSEDEVNDLLAEDN
ncbi:hypothetical protein D9613_002893 [Agrocybe pediades]|uniref:Nuclear condensin complex subunit 3 C-terminal domain-containing protein n=1 Tax=Agrocybe pediades TaxID=84607 RepID=A0A8H4QQ51_9AGAR|nr:hypothetical protein D9613_002893 [Agrocybe pediades]